MALISGGGGTSVAPVTSSGDGVFAASSFDQSCARCFSFVEGTGMLRSRGRNHAFPSAGLGRDSKAMWKSRGRRCFVTQHKRTGDARVRA